MNDSKMERIQPLTLIHRRRLLQGSLVAGGAIATGLAAPGVTHAKLQTTPVNQGTPVASPIPAGEGTPAPLSTLTDAELTTLRASIDRIIPTDDLGPGAVDSGVDVFIERALGSFAANTLPLYQSGLAALDTAAGSGGFAALDDAAKDDLLTQIAAGSVEGIPDGFFTQLITHTRQGMFGDPIYGGNKDFAGWDLMGYPGIKLVWTAEDQAIGSDVTPEHVSVSKFGGNGAQ
jgi:gluconate 2-dehydrogenase gamma chain